MKTCGKCGAVFFEASCPWCAKRKNPSPPKRDWARALRDLGVPRDLAAKKCPPRNPSLRRHSTKALTPTHANPEVPASSSVKRPIPPSSPTPTSPEEARRVDPRSITHIIVIADKTERIANIRDMPHEIEKIWSALNTEMAKALHALGIGVPCYYVEAGRYKPSTKRIDTKHFMGAHLNRLYVPDEHSVFVQLPVIAVDGKEQEVTVETVFRTTEPRCIISETPLMPCVP